ncbi:DUF1549 domain-containing protein [bacterium]|nr:DUF1549 domain-containing protein [bacterium]
MNSEMNNRRQITSNGCEQRVPHLSVAHQRTQEASTGNRKTRARIMKPLLSVWLLLCVVTVSGACRAEDISPIKISRLIDQRLQTDNIDKSQFSNGPEFLRRVTLDLAGRIPTISEVHEYLGSTSDSGRIRTIDRLMSLGVYYRNMATFWRRSWVPQADTPEFASVSDGFELWLALRLNEGVRYDELVVEVMTLDSSTVVPTSTTPIGFYDANQSKPENLAASSSRAFLGINLDCAQCHDHPFARWTRGQFWQTAAFFAPPEAEGATEQRLPKVRIPDTELEYGPGLLTQAEIQWPQDLNSVSLRRTLVDWMRHDPEQLLAKNAINRLWSHFFGEAIIEPIDDLSRVESQSGNRASLLHDLTTAFVASGYDLDMLVKGIVGSNGYRLTTSSTETVESIATASSESPEETGRQSASIAVDPIRLQVTRGLTGEQLYDSLQTAAGLPAERSDIGRGSDRSQRREFSSRFYVERTHNAERSISQALTLMNGTFVSDLASAEGNRVLASVLSSPFMNSDEQIDTVFIAVLGRHAREAELQVVKRTFGSHHDSSHEEHLGNLFWTLVNSSEFNTNH